MATYTQETTPRAWVGCLGCYNSGRLNGKWLEGTEAGDTEGAGLTNADGFCLVCGADEFWVFDHENYAGLISGECSPMEAQESAELLASVDEDEREVLEAWVSNFHIRKAEDLDLDDMRSHYIGEFSSDTEVAEHIVDETGLLSEIPDSVARYFDYEAYGRDLDMGGDVWSFNGHYFWGN